MLLLLERHYDPRYRHGQRGKVHVASFDATDPDRAAAEIGRWIEIAVAGASIQGDSVEAIRCATSAPRR